MIDIDDNMIIESLELLNFMVNREPVLGASFLARFRPCPARIAHHRRNGIFPPEFISCNVLQVSSLSKGWEIKIFHSKSEISLKIGQ